MAVCRSCGAEVLWVPTPSGSRMPLDRDPVAGGNIEVIHGRARVVTPDPEVRRFVSHFATCPHADQHRRR